MPSQCAALLRAHKIPHASKLMPLQLAGLLLAHEIPRELKAMSSQCAVFLRARMISTAYQGHSAAVRCLFTHVVDVIEMRPNPRPMNADHGAVRVLALLPMGFLLGFYVGSTLARRLQPRVCPRWDSCLSCSPSLPPLDPHFVDYRRQKHLKSVFYSRQI